MVDIPHHRTFDHVREVDSGERPKLSASPARIRVAQLSTEMESCCHNALIGAVFFACAWGEATLS
jgi:hypothetical protein